jgi:hypothetical protein
VHTFHVIIFHVFSLLVKLNVTVHIDSNTLRRLSDLQKFENISKEN